VIWHFVLFLSHSMISSLLSARLNKIGISLEGVCVAAFINTHTGASEEPEQLAILSDRSYIPFRYNARLSYSETTLKLARQNLGTTTRTATNKHVLKKHDVVVSRRLIYFLSPHHEYRDGYLAAWPPIFVRCSIVAAMAIVQHRLIRSACDCCLQCEPKRDVS
jgi:hypothetical protein